MLWFPCCILKPCELGEINTLPPYLLRKESLLLLAVHHKQPGDDDNTEGRGKLYNDPGSLMTSVESLDKALPEAKGVSASLNIHWSIP